MTYTESATGQKVSELRSTSICMVTIKLTGSTINQMKKKNQKYASCLFHIDQFRRTARDRKWTLS